MRWEHNILTLTTHAPPHNAKTARAQPDQHLKFGQVKDLKEMSRTSLAKEHSFSRQ